MKYFKPELLARFRSSDDDVADAAAKEWDDAAAAYQARFKSIQDGLPQSVRRLCAKVTLHDARFLGAAIGKEEPFFGLLIQLEGRGEQPGEVLQLNYDTVSGPKGGVHVRTHSEVTENSRKGVWILYDEFDQDAEHPFFTHMLLLSDGREIEVRFNKLSVRRLRDVFTSKELTERDVTWPLAESMA